MSDSIDTLTQTASKSASGSVAPSLGATADAIQSAAGDSSTVLHFVRSMPGLDGHEAWQVLTSEESRPFLFLQSQAHASLTLLVIEPRLIVENYEPRIAPEILEEFGFDAAADHLLLAIVTVASGGRSTVNLKAPIVVCPSSMKAVQLILENGDWPIHYPLYAEDAGEDSNE